MGTPPVLLRLLKMWALLLLLLQGAWQPAFSHGVHAHAASEALNKKEPDFGVSIAQWNPDVVTARGGVGGVAGFHSQGHCEGLVREITPPARSCCALPAVEEAWLVSSECGSPCCRRQTEVCAAFEGGGQRFEVGIGVMSEVGFEQGNAGCCCVIKVDLPTLEPVVPPASAPSGGTVPEFSWTTFRMEPGFTRRSWDPQWVGEARILASVRAQRGTCRVLYRVEGEAVEVLNCSFLL